MIKDVETIYRPAFDAVTPQAANHLFTNAEADAESRRAIQQAQDAGHPFGEGLFRAAAARLILSKRRKLRAHNVQKT